MKNKKILFISVLLMLIISQLAYAIYPPYQPEEEAIKESIEDKSWPLAKNVLTSCYGYRYLESNKKNWHQGLDLEANPGTTVFAVQDGVVYYTCNKENFNVIEKAKSIQKDETFAEALKKVSSPCAGFGMNIILEHPDGSYTRYNHLSRIDVKKGQEVKRGEQIGLTGNTGFSEGPHLDLKVFYSKDFRKKVEKPPYKNDPLNYLPRLEYYVIKFTASSCFDSPTLAELQKDIPVLADIGDIALLTANQV